MKDKAILFIAAAFLFGTLVCERLRAQQPQMEYDYHLPGLDANSKTRVRPPVAREPRVIDKGPLALTAQDLNYYASLLAEPNTGLIRLFPRINPKSAFAYAGERPKINGEGAYFSFHYRAHEYGWGSDLQLEAVQNFKGTPRGMIELPPRYTFSVGLAGADFGMLTNIGDVPLTDLTASDSRVAYLLTYRAPQAESEARAEFQRFGRGVILDGVTYNRVLPCEVSATYLLRSINYDRSDVLVAFHVDRRDPDGSVVIAWELLKSYPVTQLARNK